MKILYVTTIGSTMNFFRRFIEELIKDGHRVDIATNETISVVPDFFKSLGCKAYSIETSRSPFNKGNLVAINQIKKIVSEEHYDIVHCHTPIAAMCTRFACRKVRKNGTRVFYTAHGFHFYKGAPLKNWMIFYPVEKICSYFTDVLITINQEDYALAQKKMKAKKVVYVPGVGIDLEKFGKVVVDKAEKRQELGIPSDAKLLLSVGELNENKNHEVIIRALAKLNNTHVHYCIAGKGNLMGYLKNLSLELGLTEQVHLIGYRNDVVELLQITDIFCFPSKREGLGMAAIEAMACGIPIVTSNVHGIKDYSQDGITGYTCSSNDVNAFLKAIERMIASEEKREEMRKYNLEFVKRYSIEVINNMMNCLYRG